MNFTYWSFGSVATATAVALAALTLLHVLRSRPTTVVVPTLQFWPASATESYARSFWQRFRHPLTWLLLAMIPIATFSSLGRPQFTTATSVSHVFILDVGPTMAARESRDGRTRLDEATKRLMNAVRSVSTGDRVAVIVADPQPRVILNFDEPRVSLQRRVAAIAPLSTPAPRADALRMARLLTTNTEKRLLTVISDHDWPVVDGERIIRVGTATSNAAIVGGRVTFDSPADPLSGTIHARIVYRGQSQITGTFRAIRPSNIAILEKAISLAPNDDLDIAVATLAANGETIRLTLDVSDALVIDNTLELRLPTRSPIRVRIDDALPSSFRSALAAIPGVVLVTDKDSTPTLAIRFVDDAIETIAATPVLAKERSLGTLAIRPTARHEADSGPPLATISGRPLVSVITTNGAPQLRLSSAVFSANESLVSQPSFVAFLIDTIHRLAGWRTQAEVIPASRVVSDPLWVSDEQNSVDVSYTAADRASADLTLVESTTEALAPSLRSSVLLEPFELLLVIAAIALLVDAMLFARGRIV